MCMGHSHKQENPQNSEAKWSIHDILDKGEKHDRFWDFQREIGNSQGAEKSGKQILRKLRCNGTEGNVVNRCFMAPSLIHMCYSQHVKVIMIKFLSWSRFFYLNPFKKEGRDKKQANKQKPLPEFVGFYLISAGNILHPRAAHSLETHSQPPHTLKWKSNV